MLFDLFISVFLDILNLAIVLFGLIRLEYLKVYAGPVEMVLRIFNLPLRNSGGLECLQIPRQSCSQNPKLFREQELCAE